MQKLENRKSSQIIQLNSSRLSILEFHTWNSCAKDAACLSRPSTHKRRSANIPSPRCRCRTRVCQSEGSFTPPTLQVFLKKGLMQNKLSKMMRMSRPGRFILADFCRTPSHCLPYRTPESSWVPAWSNPLDYTWLHYRSSKSLCVLVPTCDNPKPHLSDGLPLITLVCFTLDCTTAEGKKHNI